MRYRLLLIVASFILAACGTVADPRPTFEPTNTALPRAANIEPTLEETEAPENTIAEADTDTEVAEEPTTIPPTETPIPTATLVPTDVPTEVPTEEVTEEATEEATEEQMDHNMDDHSQEAAASTAVVVNGIEGDAEVGEFWFNGGVETTMNNVTWHCSTCHNVEAPEPGNGPFLYGIANHAAEHGAEAGLDAVEYLADSILNPQHIIAPPQVAPDGTEYVWEGREIQMPTNWGTVLDDTQVADLVAFLMTQTQEVTTGAHQH